MTKKIPSNSLTFRSAANGSFKRKSNGGTGDGLERENSMTMPTLTNPPSQPSFRPSSAHDNSQRQPGAIDAVRLATAGDTVRLTGAALASASSPVFAGGSHSVTSVAAPSGSMATDSFPPSSVGPSSSSSSSVVTPSHPSSSFPSHELPTSTTTTTTVTAVLPRVSASCFSQAPSFTCANSRSLCAWADSGSRGVIESEREREKEGER